MANAEEEEKTFFVGRKSVTHVCDEAADACMWFAVSVSAWPGDAL